MKVRGWVGFSKWSENSVQINLVHIVPSIVRFAPFNCADWSRSSLSCSSTPPRKCCISIRKGNERTKPIKPCLPKYIPPSRWTTIVHHRQQKRFQRFTLLEKCLPLLILLLFFFFFFPGPCLWGAHGPRTTNICKRHKKELHKVLKFGMFSSCECFITRKKKSCLHNKDRVFVQITPGSLFMAECLLLVKRNAHA